MISSADSKSFPTPQKGTGNYFEKANIIKISKNGDNNVVPTLPAKFELEEAKKEEQISDGISFPMSKTSNI